MISPIFKLDRAEAFRPQPVETAETYATIDGEPVKLAALPEAGGRMDFANDLEDPKDTPLVGYHRVVRRADLFWQQFWLWYLDNPWNIVGFGKHEGDWEFVQIATVDEEGDHPVLITASQHHSGEKREFWRVELDKPTRRPVIYVAFGSHANYYTPGFRGEDGDQVGGDGKVLDDIEWRDFGTWATWKGRWGHSTGVGQSPESPGCQAQRWNTPEVFHGLAR
jgi:hypothetical protein